MRPCFVALLLLIIPACSPPPATTATVPPPAFRSPAGDQVVAADVHYRIAAPDLLVLRAPGVPQVDRLLARVEPDGRISAGPLGTLAAAGQTPEALAAALTARLRALSVDTTIPPAAAVEVGVIEYASQSYYVVGPTVPAAGKKPFTGADTVVSALVDAGFTHESPPWPDQVALCRPAHVGGGSQTVRIIDVRRMLHTGDMGQNYLLEAGDTVFVPVPADKVR